MLSGGSSSWIKKYETKMKEFRLRRTKINLESYRIQETKVEVK